MTRARTPSRQRFCSLCGKPLTGTYVSYTQPDQTDGQALVVCASCEATNARCRLCNRPMISRLAEDGVCAGCLAERPRCAACGRPVGEGVRLQDGSQRVFCKLCAETLPACLACAAPVGRQGRMLPDGRFRCPLCDATAIDDPSQAQSLYTQVQQIAAKRMGLVLGVPTPLVPVDRAQLDSVLVALNEGHPVEQRRPRGIYARKGTKRGIYVELGLPRVDMIQVIAHELGHAWQMERKPLMDDPVVVEGFAEWVAYKTLEALGESSAMQLMVKRQDVYGEGLRQMLATQPSDQTPVADWRKP